MQSPPTNLHSNCCNHSTHPGLAASCSRQWEQCFVYNDLGRSHLTVKDSSFACWISFCSGTLQRHAVHLEHISCCMLLQIAATLVLASAISTFLGTLLSCGQLCGTSGPECHTCAVSAAIYSTTQCGNNGVNMFCCTIWTDKTDQICFLMRLIPKVMQIT